MFKKKTKPQELPKLRAVSINQRTVIDNGIPVSTEEITLYEARENTFSAYSAKKICGYITLTRAEAAELLHALSAALLENKTTYWRGSDNASS